VSQSTILIFAVQAISEAVAEFVLKDGADNVNLISMEAH